MLEEGERKEKAGSSEKEAEGKRHPSQSFLTGPQSQTLRERHWH